MTASSTPIGPTVGIDFGTTNTVIAIAHPDGRTESLKFDCGGELFRVYMSALLFWEERRDGALQSRVEGGPWAIEQFLEGTGTHRFIQSFKTFAASRFVQGHAHLPQALRIRGSAGGVLSHPVAQCRRLAGRRRRAGSWSGGRSVSPAAIRTTRSPRPAIGRRSTGSGCATKSYVYEPVGAAFFFAQRLRQDAVVLVADFGGGTSDFSIVRFANVAGRMSPRPLGHAGIGIAGDAFDYRIIDEVVSPQLGKGGEYESFGKILPMPKSYFANFARWNQLAMMKSSGELKELHKLARLAADPEPLHRFIAIVENDLGFLLYRAVSRAKEELSTRDRTDVRLPPCRH